MRAFCVAVGLIVTGERIALRIAAAYISYISGMAGVDRTLKQLRHKGKIGDFWVKCAADIVDAQKGMPSRSSFLQ